MKLLQAAIALGVLLPVSGCKELGLFVPHESKPEVKEPDPTLNLAGRLTDVRALTVDNMIVQIPEGSEIGEVRTAIMQTRRHPITWDSNSAPKKGELIASTRNRLAELGFQVDGHDTQLFGEAQAPSGQLRLGGIVNRFTVSVDRVDGTQSHLLSVEWQLFDPTQEKVVYTKSVTDQAERRKVKGSMFLPAFLRTLDVAVTDDVFLSLLANKASLPNAPRSSGELMLQCEPQAQADASFAFESEKQSVVTIFTGRKMGSGVIVTADGHVLTAAHVVDGQETVTIELSNKIRLPAQVVRRDENSDIALLKATGLGFRSARLLTQSKPVLGKDVYIIGSPLSEAYSLTVSRGVVSGVRSIDGVEYVQTDASINRGNSGGPMFDASGNVMGIVSWKRVGQGVEGVAFGVSVAEAIRTLRLRIVSVDNRQ